jgi:hypothetical protein
MGRHGKRRRKRTQHLPKVHGNPGELWGDQPTPWVAGGESFQRWIGRAGPAAQARYFHSNPGAATAARILGIVVAATVVLATVGIVVFR